MADPNQQAELADSAPQVRPGVSNACLRANGIFIGSTAKERFLQIPYHTYKVSTAEMVPVRDAEGSFFRRRILNPAPGAPKYFQMPGTGVHAYVPAGAYEAIQEGGRFTACEGEFKALALNEAGFPAVALGGISSFSFGEELVPELRLIFEQRTIDVVYFLGDADTALNYQFSAAACRLRELILAISPRTQILLPRMPLAHLHDQKGIDDARAAMSEEEFLKYFHDLLDSAMSVDHQLAADDLAFELFEREQVAIKTLADASNRQQRDKILKGLLRLASRCRPRKGRLIAKAALDAGLVERLSDFKSEQRHQAIKDREDLAPSSEKQPIEIFYVPQGGKNYCCRTPSGEFTMLDRRSAGNHLVEAGYSSRREEEGLSEVEQCLTRAEKKPVDWAGSLAGRKAGMHEIGGKRILVTRSPKLIEPKEGAWTTIRAFLVDRLDGGGAEPTSGEAPGVPQVKQAEIFLAWLSLAVIDLYLHHGRYRPAQALVVTGAKRVGKNVLQQLVTDVLGGRCEAPFEFMEGRTSFNGNLSGAEHWMIADEQVSKRYADRDKLKSFIKKFSANQFQAIHAKFKDVVNLDPFRRLSISLNDDPESIQVLPPLSENFRDKLVILKVFAGTFFGPATSFATFDQWHEAVRSELPAFVHALINYEIPERIRDADYRVISYVNPEIAEALVADSSEMAFACLVAKYLLAERDDIWSGTAGQLIEELKELGCIELDRDEYAKPYKVGRCLTALASSRPETYRRGGIVHGFQTYLIVPHMARVLDCLSPAGEL